jgi:hypothetical protein
VVDKTHPIVQGLGDGFDIVDEAYSCQMFEESVHPLGWLFRRQGVGEGSPDQIFK